MGRRRSQRQRHCARLLRHRQHTGASRRPGPVGCHFEPHPRRALGRRRGTCWRGCVSRFLGVRLRPRDDPPGRWRMAGPMTQLPVTQLPVHALLSTERLLPVVVVDDVAAALPLGHAIRAGGLSTIEITLRTPAALDAIRALAREGGLLVGAGTVLTRDQAEHAIDARARFIVSPGVSATVVSYC